MGKTKKSDVVKNEAITSDSQEKGDKKLTAQEIDQMSMEEVGDALEEASKPIPREKPAKKEKAAKASKPELPEFKLLHSDATTCTLSELVPLDATPIPGGKYAMREINHDWVDQLQISYENGDNLPPLDVAFSTMGFVVGDGYHRWLAQSNSIKALARLDATDESGNVNEEAATGIYNDAIANYTVEIRCHNDISQRDFVNFAFTANFKHGLPASKGAHTRYAMWLREDAGRKPNGRFIMTMEQAALLAGASVAAMKMMYKRELDKQKPNAANVKMAADFAANDNEIEELEDFIVETDTKESGDKLERSAKSLVRLARSIYDQTQDTNGMGAYLRQFIEKSEDSVALSFLNEVILVSRRGSQAN